MRHRRRRHPRSQPARGEKRPPFRDGPPPSPKAMQRLAGKVNQNRKAVAAARVHPKLRRGKKVPPIALMPPRATDGKKTNHNWHLAARIAEAQAEE